MGKDGSWSIEMVYILMMVVMSTVETSLRALSGELNGNLPHNWLETAIRFSNKWITIALTEEGERDGDEEQ
ncbi:unnamed protein product [Prunus armeniaca]|uniref:Uncharacterized protein n=1 Tax=Prunus armeniaca TaxID=36596 RepID=A0A6J5VN47_PRUAR|nr:unnamed protein product [Prunus armeniaca]